MQPRAEILLAVDWLNLNDPVVRGVVGGSLLVIVLALIIRWLQAFRDRAAARRTRATLRETREFLAGRKEEIERLAGRIIATSSTKSIAGFAIERQIEAVFTDGHASSAEAVAALKALAAERGANAIINLASVRPPSGKCAASGDAVIVRPIPQRRTPVPPAPSGAAPPPPPPPPPPRS